MSEKKEGCLKIGMPAPEFEAETTQGLKSLNDYRGQWLVLFSHPGDFTPVCTTEFLAFAKYYDQFQEINTQLLGLSVDSNPSHLAWIYNIYQNTGVEIPFPIIADSNMRISKRYGMLAYDVSDTATVRNVFIIDEQGIIRAILVYPLTNGRYIPEILRLVKALQRTDATGKVTPADWQPGESCLWPPPRTWEALMERVDNQCGYDCVDW